MVPFPVKSSPWHELAGFFSARYGLPLPPPHAAQIRLLAPGDAIRLSDWAYPSIPHGWPERGDRFRSEETMVLRDRWDDEDAQADVRRWLFHRRIPFRREVFLIYERSRVTQTTWKMVVRYWDAFAWSVGYQMMAVDHTLQWACCFHHEEVIVFGSNVGEGPSLSPAEIGPGRSSLDTEVPDGCQPPRS